MDDASLKLSESEIQSFFQDPTWSKRFPPFLSVDEAVEMLRMKKATLYDWSSRGLLKGCGRRVGKHLIFVRDRLISKIFNEGLGNDQ